MASNFFPVATISGLRVVRLSSCQTTQARQGERDPFEECPMIYQIKGPLVRPNRESAELEERQREDDESQGGDGDEGEAQPEEASDSFASEAGLSKKLEKALGGRRTTPLKRAESS